MTQEYLSSKINTCWPEVRDGQEGYVVKYKDGYTSWCPKQPFEEGNLPLGHISHLPEWHQRLIAEGTQLTYNTEKLLAFRNTEQFNALSRQMKEAMNQQLAAMTDYLNALSTRIELLHNS